jgi:DNA primase
MTAQPEDLGALKARVDLVAIVRRHVDLKRRGRDGEWGRCPLHGEKTASFKVDPGKQRFICFGCGAKGDAIDFVAAIERVSKGEAIKRLREIVGDERAKPARPAERPPPPDARAKKNRELAQEVWRQTETIADGLPFDYLTRRRGITVWDCDRVRWHPRCPWQGGTAGCIVCPVTDHATGYTTAIWRIWPSMTEPMKGRRMGLGPAKGSAARLFWAESDELLIAEGVEDALAAHQLYGLPAWAALSAGNMGALILPARFRRVLIVPDNDPPGLDGAQRLARRLVGGGRRVEIQKPKNAKDANDVLTGGESAA